MKICIDSRGANLYAGTGIGTYTKNVVQNLLSFDNTNEYTLLWCRDNYESLKKENTHIIITGEKNAAFWQKSYIPSVLKNSQFDLFHLPQNGIDMPDIPENTKFIPTIHDLIPYTVPESVGKRYKEKFLSQMPAIIKRSNAIITVSEYSKQDIIRFFDFNPQQIFVTHLSTASIFKPLDINFCKNFVKNKCGISEDFILYLGGFSARKNVHGLIEAFSKSKANIPSNIKLVIVGYSNDQYENLKILCNKLNLINDVVFAGYVPEEELPMFYNAAILFVYPSFYEGFGLPPLEAMSCATPVITSNVTSIPEIVGDAAILVDPNNIDELKTAITEVLNNYELYDKLIKAGLKKAAEFSWNRTARETLSAYENTCS